MGKYCVQKKQIYGELIFWIVDTVTQKLHTDSTAYIKYKQTEKKSPNTLKNIAYAICYYLEYLSDQLLEINQILEMSYEEQHHHFCQYLNHLKSAEHSRRMGIPRNNTCNSYTGIVFGYYQYLVNVRYPGRYKPLKIFQEREIRYTSNVGIMRKSRVMHFSGLYNGEEHQYREIGMDEIKELIRACHVTRDRLLIMLLTDTGVRIGELLGVRYADDIDYEHRCIHVRARDDNENRARSKYAEGRDVFFSERTLETLQQYLCENADILSQTEYLFVNLHGDTAGRALTVDAVYSVFKQLDKKTGIKATPHAFRHYWANARRKEGWDLMLIKDGLGHKRIDTTQNYLHITTEERELVEEEFFKKYSTLFFVGSENRAN